MRPTTEFFDWKDKEIRHLDEFYIAVSSVLVIAMIAGALLIL